MYRFFRLFLRELPRAVVANYGDGHEFRQEQYEQAIATMTEYAAKIERREMSSMDYAHCLTFLGQLAHATEIYGGWIHGGPIETLDMSLVKVLEALSYQLSIQMKTP